MTEVLITLGSNMDKEANVPAALGALRRQPEFELVAVSPIYDTPAIGRDGLPSAQPSFFNAAVLIRTNLASAAVRTILRDIEASLGRVRTADKFAPRPIDLDLAFFGRQTVDLEGSSLPDPELARYPHVALPLADIAPQWILPATGETLAQIAARLATHEMENRQL